MYAAEPPCWPTQPLRYCRHTRRCLRHQPLQHQGHCQGAIHMSVTCQRQCGLVASLIAHIPFRRDAIGAVMHMRLLLIRPLDKICACRVTQVTISSASRWPAQTWSSSQRACRASRACRETTCSRSTLASSRCACRPSRLNTCTVSVHRVAVIGLLVTRAPARNVAPAMPSVWPCVTGCKGAFEPACKLANNSVWPCVRPISLRK